MNRILTNRWFRAGLGELAKGSRRSQGPRVALGLVGMLYGFVQARKRPKGRELVFSRTLKPGEGIGIRLVRDGEVSAAVPVVATPADDPDE